MEREWWLIADQLGFYKNMNTRKYVTMYKHPHIHIHVFSIITSEIVYTFHVSREFKSYTFLYEAWNLKQATLCQRRSLGS